MFIQMWPVIIALSLSVCAGQTPTQKPPEPESIGVFFYLDSATQRLERVPTEAYKKHRGGRRAITDNVVVSGGASSFRIAANDKPSFIFKVFKDEEAGRVQLYRFTVKGKEREYEIGKWHGRDYEPNAGLAVTVAKFGESSYKLTPDIPLDSGEYALTQPWVAQIFTFGVDSSGR